VITTMDLGGLVWVRLAASLVLAAGFGVATSVYLRGLPGASAAGRLAAMVAVVYAFSVQDTEYRWFTFFLLVPSSASSRTGRLVWPPMLWPDCSSASSSS
jgi:hypothetical protein